MYKNLELQAQTIIHNSKHTADVVKLQFEELLQDASIPTCEAVQLNYV